MSRKIKKKIYWLIFRIVIHLLIMTTDSVKPKGVMLDYGAYMNTKASTVMLSSSGEYGVLFNPYKHYSVIDVLNSAFHECRHLQQKRKYKSEICNFWVDFAKQSAVHYLYSAEEMDARRYAFSWGKLNDWVVFDRMNEVIFSSDVHILLTGMRVAEKFAIPLE